MAILTWLGVPGTTEAWGQLGFDTSGGSFVVGGIEIEPRGEASWSFDKGRPPLVDTGRHPNGITFVDHVVYAVPALDPAVEALTDQLGAPPKRRAFPRGASGPEMAFFTVGNRCFIEVVESGQPAALWGIAFGSEDLDATVEAIRAAGGPVGDPKPAVQGGRIASVWKGHVGWGIAIMEPRQRQGEDEDA
jgi:hypothetical protein